MSRIVDFYQWGRYLLRDSMFLVWKGVVQGATSVRIKSDKTVVTDQDLTSEGLIRPQCAQAFPDIPFWGEEGGRTSENASWVLLCDPLDNTRKFRDGEPGSSVLLALYDQKEGKILACHVGDPSSGRIWSAAVGKPAICSMSSDLPDKFDTVQVRTCSRELDKEQSSLRLDVSHGFNVFDDEQICRLFAGLVRLGRSVFIGSNVLNQALVANGGVDAAVATAKGGPWDFAAGCRLVPDAGGTVIAYRAVGEVVGHKKLERLEQLDPFAADVLVMGCTDATAEKVAELVEAL